MKKLLRLIGIVLILLIGFMVLQTLRAPKPQPDLVTDSIPTMSDSAAIHLSRAIQIKTVSKGDTLPIDTAEFVAFRTFLELCIYLEGKRYYARSVCFNGTYGCGSGRGSC